LGSKKARGLFLLWKHKWADLQSNGILTFTEKEEQTSSGKGSHLNLSDVILKFCSVFDKSFAIYLLYP